MMNRKDLLGIRELSTEEILFLLDEAKKEKPKVMHAAQRDTELKGSSMCTLFYENSTRTKMSFLLAAEYLGMFADDLNVSTSSVLKGETLIDTGVTLDMMGTQFIVLRHSMVGSAHLLAKNVRASVISGGDGSNEHPTQALLDMFTIQEKLGTFKGLNVAIVGDIANSRVARSNVFGLTKLGAHVTLAGPATLVSNGMSVLGAKVMTDVNAAVKNADVVMALRVQLERSAAGKFPSLAEYHQYFGIHEDVMAHAHEKAFIMHPAPVNRGVELSTELIDGNRSVINEQVTNGVAMRMAILKNLKYPS